MFAIMGSESWEPVTPAGQCFADGVAITLAMTVAAVLLPMLVILGGVVWSSLFGEE